MRSLVCFGLFLVMFSIVACGDDDDGKEACAALTTKCSGTQVACDAAKIDGSKDPDAVEDCIEDAADCTAAQACLQKI